MPFQHVLSLFLPPYEMWLRLPPRITVRLASRSVQGSAVGGLCTVPWWSSAQSLRTTFQGHNGLPLIAIRI